MANNKKEDGQDTYEGTAAVGGTPAEIQKINAIRDIIFGHEMADYDQQFKEVNNLIADNAQSIIDNKEDILQRMDALQEQFNNALRSLETRLTDEIEKLQFEKTDRQVLGTLLEEIGKKIKS
ncbi:MAG: hypothetical protein AAFO69_02125 [Bacteroidota bacterium]